MPCTFYGRKLNLLIYFMMAYVHTYNLYCCCVWYIISVNVFLIIEEIYCKTLKHCFTFSLFYTSYLFTIFSLLRSLSLLSEVAFSLAAMLMHTLTCGVHVSEFKTKIKRYIHV